MPKRKNRLGPIDHEMRQLDNLKTLEPITTPVRHIGLSNRLIDLCLLALTEVRNLEEGKPVDTDRIREIADVAKGLEAKI